MKQEEEQAIHRWAELVTSRRELIGKTEDAKSGEEFTTSGDLKLDNLVAAIVLDSAQKRLPNWSVTGDDQTVQFGRDVKALQARNVQLLPSLLFTIDWAMTAPGLCCPESYFVAYVPSINKRVVTASKDDSDLWGYADLAIGLCDAVRTPEFGTKKIIQSWWRRASGCVDYGSGAWEVFIEAGLIDKERADKWKLEVFRSRDDSW